MARKAVQGYTEKSYYDNTKFLGTVATNDPVSEGYFRQLVNFDISDTGQSLTPRKGFITTSLWTPSDGRITLSKNTIIYKDNRIQQYIIYDFDSKFGYRADLDADALRPDSLLKATKITNYDFNDIYEYLLQRVNKDIDPDISNNADFKTYINSNLSIYSEGSIVTDSDAVQKYVMKLKCVYADPDSGPDFEYIFLVGIFYRKDAVDSQDLSEDTLVFTVIDFDQQPSVYTFDRNLASFKSLIPDPLQVLYPENDKPEGFVNTFPLIYAETTSNNTKKYLTLTYNDEQSFDIIPHFALERPTAPNTHWFYTYDIAYRNESDVWNKDTVYHAPVFNLETNKKVGRYFFDVVSGIFNYGNISENTPYDISFNFNSSIISALSNVPIIIVIPNSVAGTYEYHEHTDYINGLIGYSLYALNGCISVLHSYDAEEAARDLKLRLTDANTKGALLKAIEDFPDNYLYYVKTFKELTTQYDDIYGNLFIRDEILFGPIATNVALGNAIEDASNYFPLTNEYGYGAKTKAELLSYLEQTAFDECVFKFYTGAIQCEIAGTGGNFSTYFPERYQIPAGILEPSQPGEHPGSRTFYIYFSGTPFRTTWDDGEQIIHEYSEFNRPYLNVYGHTLKFIKLADVSSVAFDDSSLFKYVNNVLQFKFNDSNPDQLFTELKTKGFFTDGVTIQFYLIRAKNARSSDENFFLPSREVLVSSTPYTQALNLNISTAPPVYIPDVVTKEPEDIQTAKNFITFNNDRLVFWHKNVVYMSEPGDYYYFKYSGMHEFGERVVKVIQFKTILLVFTVQHLYAIFETEVPIQTINAEGTLETASTFEWASLPVLYNILTSDKYADAIQVFNQMVLFYSEDGQMFMIKPSTTIDSDTRFSLQYFNKAVNDILLNYDIYINERLQSYGIEQTITKDDVRIKALLSVNFIKLFFYVPGLITYIIIYDVINNRYQVYDTTTFTNIKDKMFVESGDLLITEQDDALYFTAQHTNIFNQDGNVDLTITNNFKKEPINALIDTGNINLNNHLIKRYRDLFITFKNISSKELLYNVETILDDVVVKPHYNKMLEVRNIHNTSVYTEVAVSNERDLAPLYTDNNNISNGANMLMDFSGFNSNKLITHRSSILGMSRVIRIRLQFKSKGVYKIQNFGFVFKERRI